MVNNNNDLTVIKVGVVDDHVSVTNAFTVFLNSMEGICGSLEAYSGEQLLRLLNTTRELPDILLMDVEMKGMSGVEATKQVIELYPTIKVIAFTAKVDDWTILQMIEAGVCAYLSKEFPPRVIEEAIREVYRKGKYHADLYHLYAGDLRKYSKEIKHLAFTENEKRYLQLLCIEYDYSKIAKAMDVTIGSINYYRKCVCRKFNTQNLIIIAFEARRMGIVKINEGKRNSY